MIAKRALALQNKINRDLSSQKADTVKKSYIDNLIPPPSKNLFKRSDATQNCYIDSSGSLITNTNYFTTGIIDVSSISNITCSRTASNGSRILLKANRYLKYNSSKTPIGTAFVNTNESTISVNDCAYIRLSFSSPYIDQEVQIEAGTEMTSYTPYERNMSTDIQIPEVVLARGPYSSLSARLENEKVQKINPLFTPNRMRFGAHQGMRLQAPENTIPAFELACQSGFDFVWIAGIYESADGVFYVMHDTTVDRTTDGTGTITTMTSSQIDALTIDYGANIESHPNLKVPTLESVFKLCRKYGKNVAMRINGITNYDAFCALCKKYRLENAIYMVTFSEAALLKNGIGDVTVMYVAPTSMTPTDVLAWIDTLPTYNNQTINVYINGITESVVHYAHSKGLYVAAYFVDNLTTAQNLEVMGVDIIVTPNISSIFD